MFTAKELIMNKPLSLRQFAKLAGVSPATVSHVFSHTRTVLPATETRIRRLAEEVGYTPNIAAKSIFGKSTRSIGILFSNFTGYYSMEIAAALQERFLSKGYLPIFLEAGKNAEQALTRLAQHKVDALLIGCSNERLNIPGNCRKRLETIPLIQFDNIHPGIYADSVLNEDYDGGRQAGVHLIKLGHKRFAACIYGEDNSNSKTRLAGFQDAISLNNGILETDSIVRLGFQSDMEIESQKVLEHFERLFRRPNRPTAVFATMFTVAVLVYRAALNVGLRVPEDISIVGFGNDYFLQTRPPRLTTIRQNPTLMAEKLFDLTLRKLANPDNPISEYRIPVHLQEGDSTGPVPASDSREIKSI